MVRQPLKHRSQTTPPDTKLISDKGTRQSVDQVVKGISDTNSRIYDDLKNITDQLPQNGNPLNFGDPTVNGSWRITVSGVNLSVQVRTAGVWVEKSSFTP